MSVLTETYEPEVFVTANMKMHSSTRRYWMLHDLFEQVVKIARLKVDEWNWTNFFKLLVASIGALEGRGYQTVDVTHALRYNLWSQPLSTTIKIKFAAGVRDIETNEYGDIVYNGPAPIFSFPDLDAPSHDEVSFTVYPTPSLIDKSFQNYAEGSSMVDLVNEIVEYEPTIRELHAIRSRSC